MTNVRLMVILQIFLFLFSSFFLFLCSLNQKVQGLATRTHKVYKCVRNNNKKKPQTTTKVLRKYKNGLASYTIFQQFFFFRQNRVAKGGREESFCRFLCVFGTASGFRLEQGVMSLVIDVCSRRAHSFFNFIFCAFIGGWCGWRLACVSNLHFISFKMCVQV